LKGCNPIEILKRGSYMPAIASLEDLRAAQKDLLETKENDDL